MKAIIIGSGLGGLLSAAKLAKEGYSVEVFESLPIIGGRFTNIPYHGFQLTTGALHMIPHGPAGPLASLLKEVGAEVKIVRSMPVAIIRIPRSEGGTDYMSGHRDLLFKDFKVPFTLKNQIKLAYYIVSTRKAPPRGMSFAQWCRDNIDQDWTHRISDSFFGWSLSLRADDVSVEEAFSIIENLYHFGGAGVPMGGCKGVIDALVNVIEAHGGVIHTSSPVDAIVRDGQSATGVIVNGSTHKADLIISNVGHLATSSLLGVSSNEDKEYHRLAKGLRPSAGIKICMSADEPLIGHGGVLFTPYAKRINGINEVTNIDPSLAPAGKHLIMSHQTVRWEDLDKLESEIALGLDDLSHIFAGKKYEVLLIQSYSGEWPVNRAPSGADMENKTHLQDLFVVGDGAKGEGGIEVEGIALGVEHTMKEIFKKDMDT